MSKINIKKNMRGEGGGICAPSVKRDNTNGCVSDI